MPPPRVPELRNIRLVLPTESRLAGYPASLSLSLSSTFGRQDRRRPLVLSSLSPSLLRPPVDAFGAAWRRGPQPWGGFPRHGGGAPRPGHRGAARDRLDPWHPTACLGTPIPALLHARLHSLWPEPRSSSYFLFCLPFLLSR